MAVGSKKIYLGAIAIEIIVIFQKYYKMNILSNVTINFESNPFKEELR